MNHELTKYGSHSITQITLFYTYTTSNIVLTSPSELFTLELPSLWCLAQDRSWVIQYCFSFASAARTKPRECRGSQVNWCFFFFKCIYICETSTLRLSISYQTSYQLVPQILQSFFSNTVQVNLSLNLYVIHMPLKGTRMKTASPKPSLRNRFKKQW